MNKLVDSFDPVIMDLPTEDPEYPSSLLPVTFESHGSTILSRFLLASGKGPHPVAILLHGFPGNEPNFDIAHMLLRAGWNALVIHYRGSWGSGGDFSLAHALEDGLSAVEFACSERARTEFRCDPTRLVLIGHSMGGFIGLHTAAADSRVSGVATIAAFNFGAFAKWMRNQPDRVDVVIERFQRGIAPVHGTTGRALIQETLDQGPAWDLERLGQRLRKTSLLLQYGSRDDVSVPDSHHHPLMRAFAEDRQASLQERRFECDHMFTQVRFSLCREILQWLGTF